MRRGGWVLKLYENSLSLVFVILFLASLYLHAYGGAQVYNEDQLEHGGKEVLSAFGYMATSRFWFESFQNWQSEFLSVAGMVVFTIFLRQRGSPESKPSLSRTTRPSVKETRRTVSQSAKRAASLPGDGSFYPHSNFSAYSKDFICGLRPRMAAVASSRARGRTSIALATCGSSVMSTCVALTVPKAAVARS